MSDKALPAFITLPYALERPTPPFEGDDIRSPEALVRYFIKALTKPGAKVFDPFTGLGTTLFVAEELKRNPFGIEADDQRHGWTAGQLEKWMQVVHGDSAKLGRYGLPKMDFCFTSPPYMAKNHKWNPLHFGDPKHAGYATYLKQMQRIFAAVATQMKPGAWVVVQADNIQEGKTFTPLIRDLSMAISKSLTPAGEITVAYQGTKPKTQHTTCLLFKKA